MSQVIGNRPKINTKNDAVCMDKFLRNAPELELVITKLGNIKDYISVDAPLLDYLATESEGTV